MSATDVQVELHATRDNPTLEGLRKDLEELLEDAQQLLRTFERMTARSEAMANAEAWAWTKEPFAHFEAVFASVRAALDVTQPIGFETHNTMYSDFSAIPLKVAETVELLDRARAGGTVIQ